MNHVCILTEACTHQELVGDVVREHFEPLGGRVSPVPPPEEREEAGGVVAEETVGERGGAHRQTRGHRCGKTGGAREEGDMKAIREELANGSCTIVQLIDECI